MNKISAMKNQAISYIKYSLTITSHFQLTMNNVRNPKK
jgi:hypothetical protein